VLPFAIDQFRPSVRPSVRDNLTSRSTAKMVRDRPTVTMWKLPHGLLRGPIFNPYDHLFLPNWRLTTPSQNMHRKLWSNGATYNGGLYRQPMGTYHRPINIILSSSTPRGTTFPKGVVKNRIQNCCKIVTDIQGLCTQHIGTH